MKARKGIWAVLAGVTGSAAMMTALIYRQVFVCPKKRPEQVKSPSGSQYQPYKEQAEELRAYAEGYAAPKPPKTRTGRFY